MTEVTKKNKLKIEFRSYWHTGSGRGSGYYLDALCERSDDQLPVLPGRQLKGLLRHALHRAEQWGWLAEFDLPSGTATCHEQLLFGSASQTVERYATEPGMLRVASACLAEDEREWLAQPEQVAMRNQLYSELFSTAVDEQGSAKRYSLRGLEVCIPVTLYAKLTLEVTAQTTSSRKQQRCYLESGRAWQVLELALPLLDALGAQRSRGLGEAQVSLVANRD